MKKNKSITTNFIFNLTKTISSIMFPIVTFSYSSRILGAEGIGKVNFSKSIISYFSMFAQLGMNLYGTREVAKIRDDKKGLSKFVHEMLLINGFTTCVAYIALALSMLFVNRLYDYRILLLVNSVSILMMGMGMEWLYQGLEEYRYISVRAMVFQIIAIVVMVLTVKDTDDVVNYMVVSTLAASGSYILNFFNSRKYVDFHWQGSYEIRKHLKPIFWLFATILSIELYSVLDSTMLGFLKGDETVGMYTAATKIVKIPTSLITSLGVVIAPRLSYYVGRGDDNQFVGLVKKAYHFVFLFSVPIFIGMFMLNGEIIDLVCGNGYDSAKTIMRLLSPLILIIPFSYATNNQILVSMSRDKLFLTATCIGAVTNVVFNMVLIPSFSYNGAAVASVLAETMVAVVSYINAGRVFNIKSIFNGYYQYWIAAVPILFIVYVIQWCGMGTVATILLSVIVAAIVYFGILLLIGNVYVLEILKNFKNKFLKFKQIS
jgi:O-antigen/teichoic acid export membrane protein